MTTPRVPLAPHLLQPLHFQLQPQSCTNSGKQTTRRGGTPGEAPPFRHRLAFTRISALRHC